MIVPLLFAIEVYMRLLSVFQTIMLLLTTCNRGVLNYTNSFREYFACIEMKHVLRYQ